MGRRSKSTGCDIVIILGLCFLYGIYQLIRYLRRAAPVPSQPAPITVTGSQYVPFSTSQPTNEYRIQDNEYSNSNYGSIHPNSNQTNQLPYPMEQRGYENPMFATNPSYTVPPGGVFPLLPTDCIQYASGHPANMDPPSYDEVVTEAARTTRTDTYEEPPPPFNPSFRE